MIEHLADKRKSAADIHHVSVNFRDLNDGPLSTIHAAGKFIPASLLKVPLMLAVIREAEEYPLFLHTKAPYEQQPDWTPSVATATLRPGESYTIDQPLRAMIVDSDTGAAMIQNSTIDPTGRERLYSDLGHSTSFAPNEDPEITVAHKFGERYNLSNKLRQLHDGGIVYYPPSPYILCVMIRDEDFAIQAELIQDISKAAYDAVSSQTKPSSRRERPPGRPWVIMGDFAHLRAITE